jgi:hypothetical protein
LHLRWRAAQVQMRISFALPGTGCFAALSMTTLY